MTIIPWLTLEAAAMAVSVEVEILQTYLNDRSPEKRFQPHGLLFDRVRWQSGEPDFLQRLDQADGDSNSLRSDSQVDQRPDRSYRWNETPIRLEISWLPAVDVTEREVLISVTSHDDFPVSDLIYESELDALPPVLSQLLEELKTDLPIRKIRYQQQTKAKSKSNHSHHSSKPMQSSKSHHQQNLPSAQPPSAVAPSGLTQVSLF